MHIEINLQAIIALFNPNGMIFVFLAFNAFKVYIDILIR